MTFEEFLKLIREHIGNYCNDQYWRLVYNGMKDKSLAHVEKELPYLAIHAVATDYTSKHY